MLTEEQLRSYDYDVRNTSYYDKLEGQLRVDCRRDFALLRDTCLALFEENEQKSEALAKCRCWAEHPLYEDCGKCPPCQAKARKERSDAE